MTVCVNTQLNGIHQCLFILEGCTRNYKNKHESAGCLIAADQKAVQKPQSHS